MLNFISVNLKNKIKWTKFANDIIKITILATREDNDIQRATSLKIHHAQIT
jgi:hypothetical protein